jgi:hypothetical protein
VSAPRAAAAAAFLVALAAAPPLPGCVVPPTASPGAAGDPGTQPFYRPGEVTPVPEGVVGTPDPFLAAHPAVSQFFLPTTTTDNPAPVKADYVVAGLEQVAAGWRLSCLARGLSSRGDMLEVRFELLVDRPPPAPASWPVARSAELVLGKARVTHFYGAGTGYEGRSGSLALTRVDRKADAVAYDFSVDARLEPSSAGPGTPKATPTPTRATPPAGAATPGAATPTPAAPTAAPTTSPPVATASPPPTAATPTPGATATPAAPMRVLLQDTGVGDSILLRWSGTFYVRPELVP